MYDWSFSEVLRKEVEDQQQTQAQLNHTGGLLENLQQVQSDRLSTAPPQHLSQVLQPSITEVSLGNLTILIEHIYKICIILVCILFSITIIKYLFYTFISAEKITENLTDLAKRVPPAAIVPVTAIRKAMGVQVAPENEGVSSTTSGDHTQTGNERLQS